MTQTSDPSRVTRVVIDQVIEAPPEVVWDAVTDWASQSDWMMATRITRAPREAAGVGDQIEAFTGIGPIGVRDPMTVTEWDPPRRCVVQHTGAVVRGPGILEVVALPQGGTRLVWIEELDLPLGVVGRLGWPLARPAVIWGFRRSLRALARTLESRE